MRFSSLCLATASLAGLTLLGAPVAVAADYGFSPQPTVVADDPWPQEEEVGTGWYLRGDIGYGKPIASDIDLAAEIGGTPIDGGTYKDVSTDRFMSGGIGIGYQIRSWLRADLTVDYMSGAVLKMKRPVSLIDGDSTHSITGKDELDVVPILANVYFDLGKFEGITPYVGAGAGFAWTRNELWGSVDGVDSHLGTKDRWSVAYALMAGLSYDFGDGLILDAGYRYLNVHENSVTFADDAGNWVRGKADNNGYHQARLGLRWVLD